MKIFPSSSIKKLDAYTIENEPIATIDLMERAATVLTKAITDRWNTETPVTIFAGPGNNGGDALAVARMMAEKGYKIEVFSSPISPEGMSMATTMAGEELMYFTTAANPPLNGLFRPEPNNPSITKWSGVRAGGTNWVLISWNFTSSIISTSSLLVWQSGESSPFVLKRKKEERMAFDYEKYPEIR